MKIPRLFLLSGLALLAPALRAAPETVLHRLDGTTLAAAEADALVRRLVAEAHVTGLALAVFNNRQPVFVQAYGWREQARQLPFETDTVTYGASLTKAVFATLVVQLAGEGKVDLDRPIAAYLPKPLPAYERYADLAGDERWRKFTLRMLLSHTAGLPNLRQFTPDGKLHIVLEPGTRYSYSGEGINLAQFVLETGLGLNVDELLRTRFFTPLGMARTSLTWREDFAGNLAHAHDAEGKDLGHQRRRNVRTAGSMDTTLADWVKFMSALLQDRLLDPKALAEMTRPQVEIFSEYQFPTAAAGPAAPKDTDENRGIGLAYGLGWGLLQHTPYGPAFFKEGHDDGWGNYTIVFPQSGTALALFSNSANGESIYKELLEKLIGDTFTPWKWEHYVPYDAAR